MHIFLGRLAHTVRERKKYRGNRWTEARRTIFVSENIRFEYIIILFRKYRAAPRAEVMRRFTEYDSEQKMEENRRAWDTVHGSNHRKKNFYIATKVIVNLVLIIMGAVLMAVVLRNIQINTSLDKQRENNELALEEVASIIDKNSENAQILTEIYHEGNWKILENIEQLFSKGLYDKIIANDDIVGAQIFSEISAKAGIPYLYLLSMDGKIFICPDETLYGRNPATTEHLTQENINRLLSWCVGEDGTVSPVLVRNIHGTFYFYSRPYEYRGEQYALVAGVSSWALDVRIASLNDVSAVLSRMGVINDGFLFAISEQDGLFLYYNDGKTLMSGQDAFSAGLTERIMEDGFNGTQIIQGESYYCTSKRVGPDTVVVAAANLDNVLSHDRYAVLWSVVGFNIVMILCLVYAVIVRNDFVRQGVKTEKKVFWANSPNPVYFNRTVFNKVLPLMLIGIAVVYVISFYAQTLLGITAGIDSSNVILQEITGRYEESLESRRIIEDYYNSRFLATARIITFIVEDTPEILNEPSNYYHSIYDADGNRQYLLDDEGNVLKSVANSAALQQLCDENSIDAIYIFDEDGRTIATNTPNWFFALSSDEGDQSYPFRQVLEGRTDSYLQSAMVNDLGEETQFFGVIMHYYTTVDPSGNTVYVSRYAFEEACAAENITGGLSAGGITKHSALLQIEMDQQLAGSIMATISADYVLSTRMLSGGAILVFDNSRDHVCTYSPVSISIGKTAEELGVSPKAFTGETYYGFTRINGVNYFALFRYTNDVFITTVMPKAAMFTSRGIISLVTAGVCMVLILILLFTVTVTSREEEEAFDALSSEMGDGDLNSTIFSIILPSGRAASTTMAQTRWDNRWLSWNERSPEMKLALILGWLIVLPTAFLVFKAMDIRSDASATDSVIRYIMYGGWDKGLNIFSLSASFMVMVTTVIFIQLFRIPVRLFTALLGTRGETIGHLMISIVRYGCAIGALFYCLYLFGIDSVNLLASAGIISLVIGLGAQSLIKDIIAGIFIVFEGEFRVGDIVTISGFRGTVTDIGLRTTKISSGGNIKIFNNSDITGVLNMTKETSYASVSVSIEYDQDIGYVEDVLARELPKLKDEDRRILEGPTSRGISKLGLRRYTISVYVRCAEKDVIELERYLNRALIRILHDNGIRGFGNAPAPDGQPPQAREDDLIGEEH